MNPLIHRNEDEELAYLEEKVNEARRVVAESEKQMAELSAAITSLEQRKQEILSKGHQPEA